MLPALAGCNTAAGPPDEVNVPVQFIDENPASGQGAVRNKRLVRSHVSRVNRQRAKDHGAQRLTWTTNVRHPGVAKKSAKSVFLDNSTSTSSSSSSAFTPAETSQQGIREASSDDNDSEADVQNLNLRPISPHFGALRTQAFTHSTHVDESANYYLRIILPNAFLPTQAWFKMFCDEPIVFHGFSATCNLHLALSDTYSARVKRQRMLMHKTEAIRLVNEKLVNLTYDDIEPVMLGMFTIYPEDEEIQKAVGRGRPAFVPHLPWADDMDIYIGGDPDTHRRAIAWLVDQAGGIEKLNLPGLAKATATNDLILASRSGSKPFFPWLWPVDPFILLESDQFLTFGQPSWPPQSGFADLASHLSAQAAYCFKSLSCIDQLMAEVRRRRLNDEEIKILITSRNTVETPTMPQSGISQAKLTLRLFSKTLRIIQRLTCTIRASRQHRLISMEPQILSEPTDLTTSSAAIYECCRLTCLVYSQCVVFPVPNWTDGMRKRFVELRSVLEHLVARPPGPYTLPMLVWASLVGSVATLYTPNRTFFVATLKDLSASLQISTLSGMLDIARQFVWSDSAGEQGAATVCELIRVETYPP